MMENDLISRKAAIDALGAKPPVWMEQDYELGALNQWQADVEAIKSLLPVEMQTESGMRENVEWLAGDIKVALTIHQPGNVSKIEKLAERKPEEVKVIYRNKDGSIFAEMPLKYLKYRAPLELTEE